MSWRFQQAARSSDTCPVHLSTFSLPSPRPQVSRLEHIYRNHDGRRAAFVLRPMHGVVILGPGFALMVFVIAAAFTVLAQRSLRHIGNRRAALVRMHCDDTAGLEGHYAHAQLAAIH